MSGGSRPVAVGLGAVGLVVVGLVTVGLVVVGLAACESRGHVAQPLRLLEVGEDAVAPAGDDLRRAVARDVDVPLPAVLRGEFEPCAAARERLQVFDGHRLARVDLDGFLHGWVLVSG